MANLTVKQLIERLNAVEDKSKTVMCIRSISEKSPMYDVMDIFMDLESIVVLDIKLADDDY